MSVKIHVDYITAEMLQTAVHRTPFGREYELSVHTYLDSHKAEEDNNHWMLVVGVPGSSVNPVPNQGPGAAPLHPATN